MTATTMTVEEFKVTELGPLPPEWEVVRLGDVAKVASGGSAPQGKEFFDGQNPFIRVQHLELKSDTIRRWDLITDEAVNKCSLRLYSKGTIVFPKSGASIYLEKRAILPIDAYIVGHLCAVISRSPLVDQNFLFYYLRFVRLSEQKAEGYPTLNLTEIKERRIACPPLLEQRKIAYVLSIVQTAIEKTEAVIKATRELKKSLMQHLFTYGPVSVDETENVPLKETEIGMVPERWEVLRLGDIFALSSGKARPTVIEAAPHGQHVFPVFGGNGIMGYSAEYFIDTPTVVLGRVGEYCGSVHISAPKSWISDNALYAKLFLIDVRLDYLATALSILDLNRFKKKSGQPLITQSIVCSREIPLPSLIIQQEISEILSRVHERISAEENKKQALEVLFKTLLSRLMTGKIRVKNLEVSV